MDFCETYLEVDDFQVHVWTAIIVFIIVVTDASSLVWRIYRFFFINYKFSGLLHHSFHRRVVRHSDRDHFHLRGYHEVDQNQQPVECHPVQSNQPQWNLSLHLPGRKT